MVKIIIFLFLLIDSSYAYEQSISINVSVSQQNINKFNIMTSVEEVYDILEEIKTKLNIINYNVIGELEVDFNFNDKVFISSESNLDKKNCYIVINKELNKAIFVDSFKDEVIFTVLHEISHCILSKDILNKGIDWKIGNFSDIEKKNINDNLIFETAYLYREISTCKKEKTINNCNGNYMNINFKKSLVPLFVYHEMFSDINAILLIGKIFPERFDKILEQVYQRRLLLWKENKNNKHPTHYGLEIMKNFHLMNLLAYKSNFNELIDMASKVSQRGFLDYLVENNNRLHIK